MNDDRHSDEQLTPVEQRLLALLAAVRAEAGRADTALTGRVMRNVRIQTAMRELLTALAGIAGAIVGGLSLLVPGRKR